MRALEFIRDHVTFKLPYDSSYQMKTPFIQVHTLARFQQILNFKLNWNEPSLRSLKILQLGSNLYVTKYFCRWHTMDYFSIDRKGSSRLWPPSAVDFHFACLAKATFLPPLRPLLQLVHRLWWHSMLRQDLNKRWKARAKTYTASKVIP